MTDLTKLAWKRKSFGDGDIFFESLDDANGKPLLGVCWHFSGDEEEMPMLYVAPELERLPNLLAELQAERAKVERLRTWCTSDKANDIIGNLIYAGHYEYGGSPVNQYDKTQAALGKILKGLAAELEGSK